MTMIRKSGTSMSMSKEWQQKPCGCQCMSSPGFSLLTLFCPCVAYFQAARDIDEECNGNIYLSATLLGFGCCALMALADDVATKRDIELSNFDLCTKSMFSCLCCFSCTVVNECRVYKNLNEQESFPQAHIIEDR